MSAPGLICYHVKHVKPLGCLDTTMANENSMWEEPLENESTKAYQSMSSTYNISMDGYWKFFLWWHNRKLTRMVTEPRTTEHCSLSSAQSLYCSRTRSRSYWFHAWLSTLSLFCSCLVQRSRFPNLGACWDSQLVFFQISEVNKRSLLHQISQFTGYSTIPKSRWLHWFLPCFSPIELFGAPFLLMRGAMQGWHGQMPGCLPGAQARRAVSRSTACGWSWFQGWSWLRESELLRSRDEQTNSCAVTNMTIEPLSGVIWFAGPRPQWATCPWPSRPEFGAFPKLSASQSFVSDLPEISERQMCNEDEVWGHLMFLSLHISSQCAASALWNSGELSPWHITRQEPAAKRQRQEPAAFGCGSWPGQYIARAARVMFALILCFFLQTWIYVVNSETSWKIIICSRSDWRYL